MPSSFSPRDAELLKKHLQAIVAVESLTVPLYLTAVYSFTSRALAYSSDGQSFPLYGMQQRVLSVAVQEMYHLQLAANLCNAFQVTPSVPKADLLAGADIAVPHLEDGGKPIVVKLGNLPALIASFVEIEKPSSEPYPAPNDKVVYSSIAALYAATLQILKGYMKAHNLTPTALDPHFVPNEKQIAYASFATTYRYNAITARPLVATVASAITDQGEGNVIAGQVGGHFRSGGGDEVLPEFQPQEGTRFAQYGKETHYARFQAVARDLAAKNWDGEIGGPAFYASGASSSDLPAWAPSASALDGAIGTLWSCIVDLMDRGFATGDLPEAPDDMRAPAFGEVMLSFKYTLPQCWQRGNAPSFRYRSGVTAKDVQTAMDTIDPLCLFHFDARTLALREQRLFNACQGLNSCKGQGWGGIAPEKGAGACATTELHTCGANNACKFHGGCGFLVSKTGEACSGAKVGDLLPPSDLWVPGANHCRHMGGCQTPISTGQVFNRLGGSTIDGATGPEWTADAKAHLKALIGTNVWNRARQIFAERIGVTSLPAPASATVDGIEYDGNKRRGAVAPTSK